MTIKIKQNWWESINLPEMGNGPVDFVWAQQSLSTVSLFDTKGPPMQETSHNGILKDREGFIKEIENLGGRLITSWLPCAGDKDIRYLYVWPDSALSLFHDGIDNRVELRAVSLNNELITKLAKLFEKSVTLQRSDGRVYVLVSSMDGLKLQSIGVGAIPLNKDNYEDEVVEKFQHVATDLKSATPCGRFILLNGPAGCGKTFMIRALLQSAPNATFIMVSPDAVSRLSDPSMLATLLESKRTAAGPMVFIIEDADACLVPRQMDNVLTISSLLNYTDGIVGSLLDLRIVATTNAQHEDIDEAILRPMRLCTRIHIVPLNPAKAAALLHKLTGKDVIVDKPLSLGQIYKMARDEGWTPPPASEQIGFVFQQEIGF